MRYNAAVDVGTKNLRLAYFDGKARHITTMDIVPALVGIDAEGNLIFGRAAERLSLTCPDRVISLLDYLQTKNGLKGATAYFTQLLTEAQRLLGHELEITVIGAPSALSAFAQHRLSRAVMDALPGRKQPRVVSSAVLTAYHYAIAVPSANTRKLLIADLGAGSTDFVLAEYDNDLLEVISIEPTDEFSGSFLTKALCDRALEDYEFRSGTYLPDDKLSRLQRLQAMEHAKQGLSQLDSIRVMLPGGTNCSGEVTRTDLFDLLRQKKRPLAATVRRALTKAGWDIQAVDRVLLSGELTKILGIEDPLAKIIGKSPMVMGNAGFAAADGGAVLAGQIANRTQAPLLMNITSSPYAVAVADSTGRLVPMGNALTISEGTTIPTLCRQPVQPGTYHLISGDLSDPFADADILQTITAPHAGTLNLELTVCGAKIYLQ